MNKKRLSLPLIILLLLSNVIVNTTYATLIDHGTYTTDSVTGYQWLDLTESTNYSYNDLLIALDIGGDFYGWQLATFSDVYTLFDNSGGTGPYAKPAGNSGISNRLTTGHIDLATNLLPLWGLTGSFQSFYFVQDVTPGGYASAGMLSTEGNVNTFDDDVELVDSASSLVGAALYRQGNSINKVPEPSTLAILALAIIGFTIRKSRQKI